ncbi:MAG: PAS domain-containing protein [Bacteroidetes bacterium]|nr:PAS domain-containing protein [Bacteroidota bacterium]
MIHTMGDFSGNDKYKAEIDRLNKLLTSYKEKYESELQHSRKLDIYTSLTPVAIIDWNIDSEIEYWNKAAEDIFEYSKSEVMGKYPWDFVAEDQRNDYTQKWNEFLKKEHPKILQSKTLLNPEKKESVNGGILLFLKTKCLWVLLRL